MSPILRKPALPKYFYPAPPRKTSSTSSTNASRKPPEPEAKSKPSQISPACTAPKSPAVRHCAASRSPPAPGTPPSRISLQPPASTVPSATPSAPRDCEMRAACSLQTIPPRLRATPASRLQRLPRRLVPGSTLHSHPARTFSSHPEFPALPENSPRNLAPPSASTSPTALFGCARWLHPLLDLLFPSRTTASRTRATPSRWKIPSRDTRAPRIARSATDLPAGRSPHARSHRG